MNREACQEFDERLNEVMDLRLDPNEDVELKAHALACNECGEMLESFSELHTGLSGPNKIPIALLNVDDSVANRNSKRDPNRTTELRNAWVNAIIIGALATMLLIGLTVGLGHDGISSPSIVASNANMKTEMVETQEVQANFRAQEEKRASAEMFGGSIAVLKPMKFSKEPQTSSFREVRSHIQSSEIYQYSDDLPGLLPVRGAFDCCLEWLQESLFGVFEKSSPEPEDQSDDLSPKQGCLERAMVVRV